MESQAQLAKEIREARLVIASLKEELAQLRGDDPASDSEVLESLLEGLSAVGIGVDIVSAEFQVLGQNRLLREAFGELQSKLCYEHYMGADAPCDPCPMTSALSNGRPVQDEMIGSDGQCYKVLAVPLPSAHGEPDRVIEVVQDITEERKAEEALMESEQRFRAIAETAKDCIFTKDLARRYTYINRAMAELFGCQPEDLIGKTPEEIFDPEYAAVVREVDRMALEGGIADEERALPIGDQEHVFHTVQVPLRDRDGEVSGICGIVRDITERKKIQSSLAQSDRLVSMGMLAAGVAHEINNPLTHILYNLDSLTEDLPRLTSAMKENLEAMDLGGQEQPQYGTDMSLLSPAMMEDILDRLRDTLSGTRRIRDIARGLGTFSRVDEKRLTPVKLWQVIETAINIVHNEIKYRAHLVKEYGTTSAILANDGRLSQVFLNLVVNAAHAIDEGDIENNEIFIRTWQEGAEVCAEVRDTGRGITDEDLPHLFEPFFTTKEIGVGTGLGLPISKNIVESLGGSISVTSEVGKGSSFVVKLPVGGSGESRDIKAIDDGDMEPEARGRILVVDDEAPLRATLKRMLRGHQVVEAANGEQARQILEQDQEYDVILCDMMMPRMSGVDVHKWLAGAYPRLADRLIFVTGGAFTPRAREYLAKVDNLRLEKPFDARSLRRIIRERLLALGQSGTNGSEAP